MYKQARRVQQRNWRQELVKADSRRKLTAAAKGK